MKNTASDFARDHLIKPFEGLAAIRPDGMVGSYPDPGSGGVPWTIGYGSTGADINQHTVWTTQQCEERLTQHLSQLTRQVLTLSPDLDDKRLAAIISFCYNVGLGSYRISTLRKRINEQDWVGAKQEIVKWNKARGRVLKGLTRRRQAEALLL